jgi:hypothetical protein
MPAGASRDGWPTGWDIENDDDQGKDNGDPVIILSESSYDGLGEKFRKAISRGLNRI